MIGAGVGCAASKLEEDKMVNGIANAVKQQALNMSLLFFKKPIAILLLSKKPTILNYTESGQEFTKTFNSFFDFIVPIQGTI